MCIYEIIEKMFYQIISYLLMVLLSILFNKLPWGWKNAGFVNGNGAEYVRITGLIFAAAPPMVKAPAAIEAEISQLQSVNVDR